MNIFSRLIFKEYVDETRLGCPSPDYAAYKRRMNAMATMAGMRGFSVPPLEPKVHPTFGTTRGERKRAAHAAAGQKEIDRQQAECDKLISRGLPEHYARRQFGSLSCIGVTVRGLT